MPEHARRPSAMQCWIGADGMAKFIISFLLILGIIAFLHNLVNSRINATTREWCLDHKDSLPGVCGYVIDYCNEPGQMRCQE